MADYSYDTTCGECLVSGGNHNPTCPVGKEVARHLEDLEESKRQREAKAESYRRQYRDMSPDAVMDEYDTIKEIVHEFNVRENAIISVIRERNLVQEFINRSRRK